MCWTWGNKSQDKDDTQGNGGKGTEMETWVGVSAFISQSPGLCY